MAERRQTRRKRPGLGPKTGRLCGKQARFVDEYLIDRNAAQAAIRAGYSPASARDMGKQNLRHPKVAAAINAATAKLTAKVELKAEWVLEQLIRNVEASREAGDFTASNKACELLGKHLTLFPDKVAHEIGGAGGGPVEVRVIHEIVDPSAH